MIESIIEEDDIIIDGIIQKTNKLGDLTDFITGFFGRPEYNTARETMLGDMCHFLSDAMEETINTMTMKACHVSILCWKLLTISFLTRKPELCAEINSIDLVWDLVCVDLPFIDVTYIYTN